MRKLVLVVSILVASFTAQAANLNVEKSSFKYEAQVITAEKVAGVEVRLWTESVKDCNTATMSVVPTLVGQSVGDGYYDQYFVDTAIFATEMACPPSAKVTKEILYSEKMTFKSFTNPNLDGSIHITLIVPKGFNLEVVEIPKK